MQMYIGLKVSVWVKDTVHDHNCINALVQN